MRRLPFRALTGRTQCQRKRPLALLLPRAPTGARLLSSDASSGDNLSLLEQVSRGEVTPLEAQRLLTPQLQKSASLEEMTALVEDFARIDHGRDLRTGLPEVSAAFVAPPQYYREQVVSLAIVSRQVIFGEGKSTEQILEIFRVMKRDHPSRGPIQPCL